MADKIFIQPGRKAGERVDKLVNEYGTILDEEAQSVVIKLQDTIVKLTDDIESMKQILKQELSDLKAATIGKAIKEMEKMVKDLKSELSKVTDAIQTKNKNLKKMLEKIRDGIKEDIFELIDNEAIQEVRRDLLGLLDISRGLIDTFEALTGEKVLAENKIIDFIKKNGDAGKLEELGKLRDALKAIKAKMVEVKNKISKTEVSIADARTKLEKFGKKVKDFSLERALEKTNTKMAEMGGKVKEMVKEFKDLQNVYSDSLKIRNKALKVCGKKRIRVNSLMNFTRL